MPASLVDDATQWLRQRGSPLTTRNLNAAQAYLAENPDMRPSYADNPDSADAVDTLPEGIELAFTDGERVPLDTDIPPEPVYPGRKPVPGQRGVNPVLPERKPNVPEDVGMQGDARGMPNPLQDETEPQQETAPAAEADESSGPGALEVAGGVGVAASLATELKKAYDADKNDQAIRDRFAKNIGSRVANATRGESESGALPRGVRPVMQDYQITAVDAALKSIKDGDMAAAEKWLSFLSLEDQKALRSSLAQTPTAARTPPTPAQRGMRAGEGLIRNLAKPFTRR